MSNDLANVYFVHVVIVFVLQRMGVFKWLAAIALELGSNRISTHLQTMMTPVVREFTNQSIPDGKQ